MALPPTKFHEILLGSSKVTSVGLTDRQTGDLISLLSFWKVAKK
jgi:hypothetical protein